MKILVVGSDKIYCIENHFIKYMRESGIDIQLFPAQRIFYDYYQKNIVNKALFKSGLSRIYSQINWEFKKLVKRMKPECILVFKGMEISPASLLYAKRQKTLLANYNPDNPFLFSGKGSGNRNITESIGLYNTHFTYDNQIKQQLEQKYNLPTHLIPFGFEVSDDLFERCTAQPEVVKACFLGNPDIHRASFLQQVADIIPLDIYGNNWSRFVSHPNISLKEPVYGDELWAVLRRYRVQLNLMRPHNPESHNMRSFETPGIGGILLAPDTADHTYYFHPEKEIFVYSDATSCIEQAKKILLLSTEQAGAIRVQARRRSVEAGYSYKDRTAEMLHHLRNMLYGTA